jgi:hypothetical protein
MHESSALWKVLAGPREEMFGGLRLSGPFSWEGRTGLACGSSSGPERYGTEPSLLITHLQGPLQSRVLTTPESDRPTAWGVPLRVIARRRQPPPVPSAHWESKRFVINGTVSCPRIVSCPPNDCRARSPKQTLGPVLTRNDMGSGVLAGNDKDQPTARSHLCGSKWKCFAPGIPQADRSR